MCLFRRELQIFRSGIKPTEIEETLEFFKIFFLKSANMSEQEGVISIEEVVEATVRTLNLGDDRIRLGTEVSTPIPKFSGEGDTSVVQW